MIEPYEKQLFQQAAKLREQTMSAWMRAILLPVAQSIVTETSKDHQ